MQSKYQDQNLYDPDNFLQSELLVKSRLSSVRSCSGTEDMSGGKTHAQNSHRAMPYWTNENKLSA